MLNKLLFFKKKEKNRENKIEIMNNSFVSSLIVKYENDKEIIEKLKTINRYNLKLKDISEYTLRNKILDEEKLFNDIAEFYSLPYKIIKEIELKNEVIEKMTKFDKEFININKFMILDIDDNQYTVAMCHVDSIEVTEKIRLMNIGIKLTKLCVSYSTFDYLYNKYLDKISLLPENSTEFKGIDTDVEIEDLTNKDNPIVKLVENILTDAIRKESSDIHIEPYRNEVKIKNRIDGVLIRENANIPKAYHDMIISRIKILASLNIAEHRVPQDGRFKKVIRNKEIDFRVSIMPTSFGESVVIRILDKKGGVLSLESLGISAKEKQLLLSSGIAPHGMILVTGPTGSGKTTTLYALLNEINKKEEKVITIEDPVEYQLDDIVQIPVNESKGLTFAKGLRSILRQDPDKIMVGEIRDSETAEIAIQAALTGHLVLTTLHANSTVESIGRLNNMGVDSYQFATALNVIIGQRLMRRVCSSCKGQGCIDCNYTGYKGRRGVFEILRLDEEIREMLINKESPIKIKERAIEKGMVEIRKSALNKVKEGLTTKEEYARVIGTWDDKND